MLTSKEYFTLLPALVWSLKHMFLIHLEALFVLVLQVRTSVRNAAASSFGWVQCALVGESRARLGPLLTLHISPDFRLPVLCEDTWLHSHFGSSLLGMLKQLEKCWLADSGLYQTW